jgi:putative ABC transport system substrate-binding protein
MRLPGSFHTTKTPSRHARFRISAAQQPSCHTEVCYPFGQEAREALAVKRREFITLLGGAAAAWPVVARAQQPERMRRVGVLIALFEGDPEGQARLGAFRKGLQELGWIEGRNIQIEYRWAGADMSLLQTYAAELVALKPEVIFAASGTPLAALHRETRTIPIIFANSNDPVTDGFVASLARPGGNISGFTLFEYAVAVKWLELLKQIAPQVTRAAVIFDPAQPSSPGYVRTIEGSAASLGVRVSSAAVRNGAEIERAISVVAEQPNGGLIVLASPVATVHRELIITLAARHRLPAVYPFRLFVSGGGLASYGVELLDLYRRSATYIDRILKGERPGELPIQAATKFELIINLKTANTLGLDPPPMLLARTDEVIE